MKVVGVAVGNFHDEPKRHLQIFRQLNFDL